MASKHHLFFVAVHALFIKDNQILLSERKNTGWMDGFYSVPAGHVDGNETIWAAMQREIFEETGLQISQQHQPSHVMHRIQTGNERIDYFFVIKNWISEPQNKEPEKCAELKKFPLDRLPKNTIPYIKFAINEIQAGKIWSEFKE